MRLVAYTFRKKERGKISLLENQFVEWAICCKSNSFREFCLVLSVTLRHETAADLPGISFSFQSFHLVFVFLQLQSLTKPEHHRPYFRKENYPCIFQITNVGAWPVTICKQWDRFCYWRIFNPAFCTFLSSLFSQSDQYNTTISVCFI